MSGLGGGPGRPGAETGMEWADHGSVCGAHPARLATMGKRSITLISAGLLLVLVITIGVLWKRPPLLYYIQLTTPHRLPTRLAGSAFEYMSDQELPDKTVDPLAVFTGGHDPFLFVRFETDGVGIEHILESFGGEGAQVSTLGTAELRSMTLSEISVFPFLDSVEARLGMSLFDQASVESARLVDSPDEHRARLVYRILIDEATTTVYMVMQLV